MTRYYKITIEPLTGPFGQPTGRTKVCESEGENISEALDELSVELHGFNEDETIYLPKGFHPL
jgi:hypothetical protein